ncbi:Slam-dependent surface lipoprotein [Alloalcanivorax sp. C16-2]|uniref:Slam-dependent surface lipoprotein n=1 Tax=Alloalcanivorax sp. C16-2 TaxID=3390052 RepID=UPI0039706DAE
MKEMTFKAALAVAALSAASLTQAAVVGGESDNTYVEAGTSTVDAGPHTSGLAGIGVETNSMDIDDKVDFQFLSVFSPSDIDGVHTLSSPIDVDDPDHSGMGVFSFAQAGSEDVWFGEWSEAGGPNFEHRAVYYVGEKGNVDATMPTSGSVDYTVAGINQHSTGGALSGTLTANFGKGELDGDISNSALSINIDADITGSSFSGDATATDLSTLNDYSGVSVGEFYGSNAAALAGMATFSGNSDYDTAFGGAR